jgi:menaquinone-dependent protoporphyrinogen oxidase
MVQFDVSTKGKKMERKILVTYASTHGSTREIAEVVAETLGRCGLTVDIQPLRKVRQLDGYQAVVLGAPLYIFRWHKDARRFLTRFQKRLAKGLPAAVFAGGPFSTGDEAEWQEVRTRFAQELARYDWFKPMAVEIVGGRFDPDNLRFPWNLLPALRQMQPSDLRDWNAIRTWAASLGATFAG